MNTFIRNLLAIGITIISFAVTVGIVVGFEWLTDVNLFSFMWWGFIPAGAFVVGLLAASGYYFGALKLNVKPGGFALASLFVLVSLVQVALYYAQYATTRTADGQPISALIEFPRFVAWTLSHARYGLSIHGYHPGGPDAGVEVGWAGYVIALVQFLGLLAGGFGVYFFLGDKPYCKTCSKYLKQTLKMHYPFAGDLQTLTDLRQVDAPSNAYFDALAKLPAGSAAALELELSACPQCSREALQERPMFAAKDGKLAYQGDAYRTLWNSGVSSASHLAALQSALASTPPPAPPPPA